MKTFYRRHLPHLHFPNATYFITFRLANSLPKDILLKLKREHQDADKLIAKQSHKKNEPEQIHIRKEYFSKFDAYLDNANSNECYLKNRAIAQVVSDALHFRDPNEYDLVAYCIMPNHVHMMFAGREMTFHLPRYCNH